MPQISIDGITFNGMQFSPPPLPNQQAIFAFGFNYPNLYYAMSNLVTSAGVVATDTAGVGSAKSDSRGTRYGSTGQAIIGWGGAGTTPYYNTNTNLVSNLGVVASDAGSSGTVRSNYAGTTFGTTGQAIFGYGAAGVNVSMSNIISNTGVIANDTTGVGSARRNLGAIPYGSSGLAIFAFGYGGTPANYINTQNLVSSAGVIATDTAGVGTGRETSAASYGTDKGIFAFGAVPSPTNVTSVSNLLSNTGVIASDTPGVGTARQQAGGATYGGDKSIFGWGAISGGSAVSVSNLVSNTGVVATDTTGVGTARISYASSSFN